MSQHEIHDPELKMIHIPIDQMISPEPGDIVYKNKWWTVYKEGYLSIFIGNSNYPKNRYRFYSPQCNSNELIATWRGERKAQFIETVFFKSKVRD